MAMPTADQRNTFHLAPAGINECEQISEAVQSKMSLHSSYIEGQTADVCTLVRVV